MPELALLRHGQSEWNRQNRFTGWVDVGLTRKGEREARAAGERLAQAGFGTRIGYTSFLKRAIHTMWIVLDAMDLAWIEVYKDHRLNERHYGALQGLNKRQTARKYGEEQVCSWRRGYDEPLPSGGEPHPLQHDRRYRGLIEVPDGETFKQAAARVRQCWESRIAKTLADGGNALVVAHGNSLRGLMMHLERLGPNQIPSCEFPTGQPIVYRLDRRLRVLGKTVLN